MAKWLVPAALVCAKLIAVQFCAAQETSPEASQATVASEAAVQESGANSTVAVAPDPAGDDLTPNPPFRSFSAPAREPFLSMAPASPRQPSEFRIIGSQWKSVPSDLLHDQKSIYLFPLSVARGHHLIPTAAILGATALLMTVDAHDARWARNNIQPLSGFNNVLAGYNTATAADAFGGAFYLAAILRRNIYDQETFMLAGEAVLDSEILTTVMKDIDGREAPISYPNGGNFTDSWFKVRGGRASGWIGGLGSMPSGHEIAIVALATTFADRYPHPAWHRWLAYGIAAAVGLSRVTLQSHFTSDTFAGAALGYVIAHYVVLGRQHSN